LARLVDDLLDTSDLTRRGLSLEKGRIELAAVVRTAVEQSRILVEHADHELSVRLPDERIALDADPQRLGQVLTHLLSNAVKYTPRGGYIELAAERDGAGVRVSVRDNGLGIPPDKLETIFEMFGRVDRSLETGYQGLGIGLALVNAIVKMHGGTIEAQRGPRKRQRVQRVAAGRGRDCGSRGPARARRTPNGQLPYCWWTTIKMWRGQWPASSACSVTTSALPSMEWRLLRWPAVQPDVVLMDIGLPKVNGYDVAREMRSKPWGQKMMLVAVTGWGRNRSAPVARGRVDRH
jgi:CheY-like chemotaxis protein